MSASRDIPAGSTEPRVSPAAASPAGASQRLDPTEKAGWDQMVASHRETTFFHGANWARVLRDTYGHRPHYFSVLEGDRLAATLPVMEVDSPLTGRRGVALPFTDECPILTNGPGTTDTLLRDAVNLGRQRRWKYFEYRGGKLSWPGASPSLSYFGHALPLSKDEDRIFSGFATRVRRGIRKAEKSEVRVEISQTLEAVQTYYRLHCQTRRKHGLPPQSFSFFRNIFRHVLANGQGFVALGTYHGRPIAAAVFFHLGDKAIYKFGASEVAFHRLCGNNLVMWEAIKWYSSRGFSLLHFGRGSIANEGLRQFKLSYGTQEYHIDYFRYDLAKAAFVSERDKVFGWFNRIFRIMPVPMSRLLGQMLYRHQS